jgi:hypothetical protein
MGKSGADKGLKPLVRELKALLIPTNLVDMNMIE